jgi:hypothetical protein
VGEHHPPVGTVDLPAGLDGGNAGETVGIEKRASGGGQSEQVEMVVGWDRPDVVQTGLGQIGKVGMGVLAASNTTVTSPALVWGQVSSARSSW